MKNLFSNKRCMSLIRGGITLLTLSILISIFAISPLATTQAKRSWKSSTRPNLGTTKTAFSNFCYSYSADGQQFQGLRCLRQSTKAVHFLKNLLGASSFQSWATKSSLSQLADQHLLINPLNGQHIHTSSAGLSTGYSTSSLGALQQMLSADRQRCCLSCGSSYSRLIMCPPPPPPSSICSDAPPVVRLTPRVSRALHLLVWTRIFVSYNSIQCVPSQESQPCRNITIYMADCSSQNHCSIHASRRWRK